MSAQHPAPVHPVPASLIEGGQWITRSSFGNYQRLVKPVIDRVGAALLLLLLSPVLLVIAALVWANLGSPVVFKQQRVGLRGTLFGMYKFRTMEPDRRILLDRRGHARSTATERRQTHKSPDDPRHTKLGQLLRRFSLDEVPQLWNVLRGEMSLVGPRPELERVVAGYEDWQHRRHDVKPGLTGLWQVTERRGADAVMHLHVDADLDYIDHLSFRADVRILLKTLPAALGRGG